MENDSILKTGLALVEKDLAQLPPDTKGAFVMTRASDGTISSSIAVKVNDTWSVSAGTKFKLEKTKPDWYVGVKAVW